MIKIVKNEKKYWNFIRNLRQNDQVSSGFIKQEIITDEAQKKYMSKNCDYFHIALYKEKPAGYVGVIENDIRVATHPDFQKLGIASAMIEYIMTRYPDAFAKVKVENEASRKLFEKCGFQAKYFLMYIQNHEDTIQQTIPNR